MFFFRHDVLMRCKAKNFICFTLAPCRCSYFEDKTVTFP